MITSRYSTFLLLIGTIYLFGTTCSNIAFAAASTKNKPDVINRTRELLATVQKLRGLSFTGELPVELISQERITEIIRSELDEQLTPEMDRKYSSMYELLGMIPHGTSIKTAYQKMSEEQAVGLYDTSEKRFYVVDIDIGKELDKLLGNLGPIADLAKGFLSGMEVSLSDPVIVHELTHAIDDQHFDIDANMKYLQNADSDDMALAYQSLVEGNAARIMNDYTYQIMGINASAIESLNSMNSALIESAINYNPFLERIVIAPYIEGESFVRYLVKQGGTKAVNKAFEKPPKSMEQILHPQKYAGKSPDYPSFVEKPDLSLALPDWKFEAQNTLGELLIGLMFEINLNNPELGMRVGVGWDGDCLSTWRAPNGDIAMAWVSVWDSDFDANEFYQAYLDLIDAKYAGLGSWIVKTDHEALCAGIGRAVGIKILGNTVTIVEGVPEKLLACSLDEALETSIIYH